MRGTIGSAFIAAVLVGFATVGMPTLVSARQLVLQPALGKFFEMLYEREATGRLDLSPMYEAAGIVVSDQTCDPSPGTARPKACASARCPAGDPLGLTITCLYDKHAGTDASDLIIRRPYPVKRLGDYNPDWNAFQFETLRTKLGGRLPPVGLVRTLAIAGQERSGFFEFVKVGDTSNGKAAVDGWRGLAKGMTASNCGATTCFSVHSVVPPSDRSWTTLREVLVECVARKVGNSEGPPEYCAPIFVDGSKGSFVSALTSFRNETMSVIRGLISASVFFDSGSGQPNFEAVAGLVEKAFAAEPLSLDTSRDPDAVVGVSAMRRSRIIANWQEMATVRAVMTEVPLAVTEPGGTTRNLVGVRVGLATTLYLNNRNTTDESEWRMPTSLQGESYDAAVVSTIKAEATKECAGATSKVRDSITIIECATGRW